jgi:phage FluMu gp28-like protein
MEGTAQRMRSLFTCRTDDWDFLQTTLYWFLRHTTSLQAVGDETGLGRQICWNAAQRFSGIFSSVNFKSDKHNMGFTLMNQLQAAEKQWPAKEKDILTDYFALRKLYSSGGWKFSEGVNNLNKVSHCDMAWSGAMATRAASQARSTYWGALI